MNGTTVPIVFAAMVFNIFNGYLNGAWFRMHADPSKLWSLTQSVGLVIFIAGMAINIHSDYTMFRLRRLQSSDKKSSARQLRNVQQKRYVIPRGGLYEFVSAANYLGEILGNDIFVTADSSDLSYVILRELRETEWVGFAIATQSPAALSFVIWTMANLVPRALQTHQWYIETFRDSYPKQRKALIPYLL